MTTIDLENWEHFEEELRALKSRWHGTKAPRFLFRGQSNNAWPLSTTLERGRERAVSLLQYFRLISRVRPQIESFTGTLWEIPEDSEYREWLRDFDTLMPLRYPAYEYMIYLRHHGFPSPLLDWSRSVNVAAFFAFRDQSDAERVAIFAYLERPEGLKGYSSDRPAIWSIGPYVRTHRRHFQQQCDYTIRIIREGEWRYAAHEDAFARNDPGQDLLWKFSLPSSARLDVLRALDVYNLNALSLFGSEESLMETMALRETQFVSIEDSL